MPTGTQGNMARNLPFHAMIPLTKTVDFSDTGANGTAQQFDFYLPLSAVIHYALVRVLTAFTGGSAYTCTVGQNSTSFNDIVGSADAIDLTTVGGYMVIKGEDLAISTEVLPAIKLGWSGTSTAGRVAVTLVYHANAA